MKQLQIEIPEGKQAIWQEINGLQTLVLIDEQNTALDNWQDPDIYPVWRDESQSKTLDNLSGIHVPCLDGSEFLLFPKYKELQLLPKDTDASGIEIQENPFYPTVDQHTLTTQWLNAGSEAARFVRSFGDDKSLPTPLQLVAIKYYAEKIDELSKLINGDLLSEIGSYWWACLRYGTYVAWCVNGFGIFYGVYFYNSNQALPVSLFTSKP